MNTDTYRLIEYTGELFRADTTNPKARNGATHYGSDALHFFTTKKEEVASYTQKGTTYTKTWATKPGTPLALLDIMDLKTRRFLENYISKANLDASFPIKNGKVYRNSEEETATIDGQIVFDICNLKDELGADGYYMARQKAGNGFLDFHSEIGLCKHAFGKLILVGNVNMKKEAANAQNASFRKTRSVFGNRRGIGNGTRKNNGPRNGNGNGNRKNNGPRNGNGNGNRKGNGNSVMRSLFGSPNQNKNRGEPLTMGNLNTTNIVPQKLAF